MSSFKLGASAAVHTVPKKGLMRGRP